MPLTKPTFRPGVVKTDTGLANEGGWSDANLVRFWQEKPEPVGGWQLYTVSTYTNAARGSHSWTTLDGLKVYAFGTSSKLYGSIGGTVTDITPNLHETVLEDAFSTVSGSPTVTVTVVRHRLSVGDSVTFSNHQSTVGGLTVEGTYSVVSVVNEDNFTITHASNASSTVDDGGGFVDFLAPLPAGLEDNDLTGYGTGTYGSGTYGSGGGATALRTWAVDNWGENGLFNPSGFGIFEWQPETAYNDLAFNGTFTGSADGWALGTGWAYSSNTVAATAGSASNLSQNVEGVLEGGRTYRITFDVTRSAGSLKFRVNAGSTPAVIDVDEASSAITKSGFYSRLFVCPADPVDIVFEKDASFAGSIDNVTYAVEDAAYRLTSAPARVDHMYVNPNGVVVALGTTTLTGEYNPAAQRNSDIGNNRSWTPTSGSVATENILRGGGGRLMAGLATRQQDIVWGDDGVFSLQYQGQDGDAFNIRLLGTGCGLVSRMAAAEQNGFVMWLSNTKQWFIFRGVVGTGALGAPEIVPCPLREDVWDNIDPNQLDKVHVGINPAFAEMWTFYPDGRDGDECSRAVSFAWTDGTWAPHVLARTAWIPAGVLPNSIGFGDDNRIYEHEVGNTDNGNPMGWFIETADFDIGDGDQLMPIVGIVPDLARATGTIAFTIKTREWPNKAAIERGPYLYDTAADTTVRFRAMGRQCRIRIAENSTGAWMRLGALRLDVRRPTAGRGGST